MKKQIEMFCLLVFGTVATSSAEPPAGGTPPVFITFLEGEVTFYEFDDPTRRPKIVSKGEGYVDTGRGHIGRNESGAPAKHVTVIFALVSHAFRAELSDR